MMLKTRILLITILALFATAGTAQGIGNPILVLASEKNFGLYTGEILRAEGFNAFHVSSPDDPKITLKFLQSFDVVILTESTLSPARIQLISSYVKKGGRLIAFRPNKELHEVFGIIDAGGTIDDGYMAVLSATSAGRGITPESLQLHSETDLYELKGAEKIASLYIDATTPSNYPAVVNNTYGNGRAMAFLYNLPRNIVYTRQGDYRHAAQEMDGVTGIRPRDMFTNGWVDGNKNILNQADQQMRLLTHGIIEMTASEKPLPRFWYFPDTLDCLITLNNDGEDSKEDEFQLQYRDVHSRNAMMTLYIKEPDFVSKEWVDKWRKKGFEFSGHPDDTRQATRPDWNTMDSVIKDLARKLKTKYGIDTMHTVVNHWFTWCGVNKDGTKNFAAQALIEESNGIELDGNYAHSDNNSNQGHYLGPMGWNQGNFIGSGLVMKFADISGRMINVYQQITNVYDQEYWENNDHEGFYNCFRGLVDRSLDSGVYSFVAIKAHNNEYHFSKEPLMRMLDYASSRGIPVWTEVNLLRYLKAKDKAHFTKIVFSNNSLSFNIISPLQHTSKLTVIIPYSFQMRRISKLNINGKDSEFIVRTIKGIDYAMLAFQPGKDYQVKVVYRE